MELLTALERQSEQAEVFRVTSESTSIQFEANEIKSATSEETHGVALRAIVDGRMGFTAAAGNADARVLLDNLIDSARYGERVEFSFPGREPGADVKVFDAELAQVPVERFAEIGREIVSRLRAVDADAQVDIEISRGVHRWSLRNSNGAEVESESSSFDLSISVNRVRGDDVLIIGDHLADIALPDDWSAPVEHLADLMERAKQSGTIGSGHMPVLFSPKGSVLLAYPIILATDGENVLRGTSPLSDKLGEQVFDTQFSLWDDPTLPGRPASDSHDDEGVPCRRKALISSGVSSAFVYDLKTASLMGTESTGNGSRSLFSPPSPSHSNLVIEPGKQTLNDIIAGIDRGILVHSVLGLGQGNTISGAFSNTVGLAFAIRGGEIAGRVKDVSVAGNVYQDMSQIGAISTEGDWVYGSYWLPYLLLPELNVVAKV